MQRWRCDDERQRAAWHEKKEKISETDQISPRKCRSHNNKSRDEVVNLF
jgi:hypothetical protein